jgi:adenylate kinase family enzyme
VSDFWDHRVVQRVSVVGNSGSGKSRLAAALAARLGVPYVELDSIFHQPGWSELPRDEFRARVEALAAGDAWVIDGNYTAVRDLVWARADTVVWIDLSRPLVMRRVIGRTLRRAAVRRELWNGNREPWSNWLTLDPERSIIMWSWTQHAKYRLRYAEAMADPALAHLRFVRLRSPAEVRAFLNG